MLRAKVRLFCGKRSGEPIRSRIVRSCLFSSSLGSRAVRMQWMYFAGEMEKPAVAGMDVERNDRHGRFADKSKDRRRPRFVLAPVQSVLPCGNFPGGEDDQQSSVLQVGQRLPHSAGIVPLFAVERVDIDEIVL